MLLLELEDDNDYQLRVAKLPPPNFNATGLKCKVSGFGMTKYRSGVKPNILRETTVQVHSAHQCQEMFKSRTHLFSSPSMICAGGEDSDACQVIISNI